MKRFIFLLFYVFCSVSCGHHSMLKQSTDITLIIRGYNLDMRVQSGGDGRIEFPFDLEFFDGYNLNRYIISSEEDTVTIPASIDWVEVNFTTIPMGSFSFLFKRGDTVVIDYSKCYPHAQVLNRNVNDEVLNYNQYVRSNVTSDGISSNHKIILLRRKISNYNALKQLQDSCNAMYVNEVRKEDIILDSMHRVGMLDDTQYNYRRMNILRTFHSIKTYSSFDSSLLCGTTEFQDFVFSDSLFNYSAYRYFLTHEYYDRLRKTPVIESSNGHSPNYSARFDSIAQWPMASERLRCYMLTAEMRDICKHESGSNIEHYAQRYLSITGDTALLNSMLADNTIDLNQSADLNLITPSGERLTYDSLLARFRGQLVYVDFWAAWCAPCLRSLPDAAALRAEYAKRDVAFVYLSLDTHDDMWRKAMQKHYLTSSDCYNYLVTNPKTAKILEALRIPPIPRYMLYGRDGRLLHDNAPGPHGEAIRKLLDAELKKH